MYIFLPKIIMVSSCLLCLNSIEDQNDSIETNSALWKELDIEKKLEKHFWSLRTIQPNSWICYTCWEEVDNFNKFYLRIEEAHINVCKIKVAVEGAVEVKQEITAINNGEEESNKVNMTYAFFKPEKLIDATRQEKGLVEKDFKEFTTNELKIKEEPLDLYDKVSHCIDSDGNEHTLGEMDLDNVPLNGHKLEIHTDVKPHETDKGLTNRDILAKGSTELNVYKNEYPNERDVEGKPYIEQFTTSELIIKEEPLDLNDTDLYSVNSDDNAKVDPNFVPVVDTTANGKSKKRKPSGNALARREENDKFIAKHFKNMICDLCQLPLKDFSDMQKHFLDIHQQSGYVVCCNRKFDYRTVLIDHLHSHLNPEHFKCDQCGKVLANRLSLERHLICVHGPDEIAKKHSCDICGKSFTASHLLRTHKLTHMPEEEKKFPCELCDGKSYASTHLLHRHLKQVHLKKFLKMCHICGKFLRCYSGYVTHMKIHERIQQKPPNVRSKNTNLASINNTPVTYRKGYDHRCTECPKAFNRAAHLKEHMATHTGIPLYTCPWCPTTFNFHANMCVHCKKKHPKEWEEAKLQKNSSNIIPNIVDDY